MAKNSIECSRREIFDVLYKKLYLETDEKIKNLEDHLSTKVGKTFTLHPDQRNVVINFFIKVKQKWEECNRTIERFLFKNEEWLKYIIKFQVCMTETKLF